MESMIIGNPDFGCLQGDDAYGRYFNLVSHACGLLNKAYDKGSAGNGATKEQQIEQSAIAEYSMRLLRSIRILRLQYTYQAALQRRLYVDLTDSGFPNHQEMANVDNATQVAQTKLDELPKMDDLKSALVGKLINDRSDQPELLVALSDRERYTQAQQPSLLFLPLSPGKFWELGYSEDQSSRLYAYTWGVYSLASNRPYVYMLTFEQNAHYTSVLYQPALFLRTVHESTRHVGDLQVAATAIDNALEDIHPKMLKRICIGPLYSHLIFEGREQGTFTENEVIINALLNTAERADDFILMLTEEAVFSKGQKEFPVTFWESVMLKKNVREIFPAAIDESTTIAVGPQAPRHAVLLPHRVLQHVNGDVEKVIRGLASDVQKLAYTSEGDVDVVT